MAKKRSKLGVRGVARALFTGGLSLIPYSISRAKDKKSQSIRSAERMAPQWLRHAYESIDLVNSTMTPRVFFDRYDFLLETLQKLISTERIVEFDGEPPSVTYRRTANNQFRSEEITRFI